MQNYDVNTLESQLITFINKAEDKLDKEHLWELYAVADRLKGNLAAITQDKVEIPSLLFKLLTSVESYHKAIEKMSGDYDISMSKAFILANGLYQKYNLPPRYITLKSFYRGRNHYKASAKNNNK